MTALVRFDGVSLGYGGRAILQDVHFTLAEGDFLGLVGPNGAGKTTVLRALLGMLPPMNGTLTRAEGLRFGYVPQRDQVSGHFPLRVLDVVLMGRYDRIGIGRRPGARDERLAYHALEQVGITELAERRLTSLSGGQKQRTLIARALVGEPNVLVLDEPTTGMDLVSTTQILGLVRDLHERDGLTVLMVSHALNEVANYVERIALVVRGRIRVGPVEEILTEETLQEVYGIPVDVKRFNGHRVVLAKRSGDVDRAHPAPNGSHGGNARA
ncbi:MAG TPA: metal ABC transporter ATP-binding protein [Gemmatimonadaceae bacterium]|nr:metal ABC transporter ATP-binding protein [Gemmatimonadaceae bacterium]